MNKSVQMRCWMCWSCEVAPMLSTAEDKGDVYRSMVGAVTGGLVDEVRKRVPVARDVWEMQPDGIACRLTADEAFMGLQWLRKLVVEIDRDGFDQELFWERAGVACSRLDAPAYDRLDPRQKIPVGTRLYASHKGEIAVAEVACGDKGKPSFLILSGEAAGREYGAPSPAYAAAFGLSHGRDGWRNWAYDEREIGAGEPTGGAHLLRSGGKRPQLEGVPATLDGLRRLGDFAIEREEEVVTCETPANSQDLLGLLSVRPQEDVDREIADVMAQQQALEQRLAQLRDERKKSGEAHLIGAFRAYFNRELSLQGFVDALREAERCRDSDGATVDEPEPNAEETPIE